ncbi:MAG: transposase [Chloroflexi bacterium]|nr:transposase [Chloroflexota bacterium]
MKLLKGRSSYELFRQMPEIKTDAKENSSWQRGFAAREVPEPQIETVRRYIRTQDQRLEKYES